MYYTVTFSLVKQVEPINAQYSCVKAIIAQNYTSTKIVVEQKVFDRLQEIRYKLIGICFMEWVMTDLLNDFVHLSGPKYKRIIKYVRQQIHEGHWTTGAKLPSESELMADFAISRHTVRQAIKGLEAEGLVRTEHGRGSFVTLLKHTSRDGIRSGLIGVLVNDLGAPMVGTTVDGTERYAAKSGFSTILAGYDPQYPEDECRSLVEMVRREVEGIIVFPSFDSDAKRYGFLLQAEIPLVMVDNLAAGLETDAVTTDNIQGAYVGTKKLLESGCRTIGFISGFQTAWTSRERLTGFRRALWEAGISDDSSLITDGAFSPEFGQEACRRLRERHPGLDGLFVANHPIANGVVRELVRSKAEKLINLATFDEMDSSLSTFLPYISISQPSREIGEKAAELLLDRISRKQRGEIALPARHLAIPAIIKSPH